MAQVPSAVAHADGSGRVFPGTPGSNTEVPRETLVTALGQRMKLLSSTMDLQPGVPHVEVAAPAFGAAELTEVSN